MRSRNIALLLALVVGLFALGRAIASSTQADGFLRWVQGTGPLGIAVFAAAYALATVLLVPGSLLTMAGGVAFGLARGFLAVAVGAALGSSLSFLVARYLARDWVEQWMRANPRFLAVDRAVGREGWKIVLLTRLSPVFPFVFLNYAFGLTRIRFWHYALATWAGILPGTFMYVYLGTLGRTGLALAGGQTLEGLRTVLQLAGFGATVLVTVLVTRIARRALREAGV